MVASIRTIKEITDYTYTIPIYQRGYRWTENNVLQLVEDIYEGKLWGDLTHKDEAFLYMLEKKNYSRILESNIRKEQNTNGNVQIKQEYMYCIQPLVVFKRDDEQSYIIIDGQQRITTISIMLSVLKYLIGDNNDFTNYNYKIELTYQSRDKSAKLIKALYNTPSIEELRKEFKGNIDFEYIFWSFETILSYYEKLGATFCEKYNKSLLLSYYEYLQFVLLHCVQFIWYDASNAVINSNEQKVFANFNTGKLALTNAELIKALFMNPANFGEAMCNSNIIKDRQIIISEAWNMMETKLHDSKFWTFIPHPNQYNFNLKNHTSTKYDETRIDILFDFFVRKKQIIVDETCQFDEYTTFIAINKWITNKISTTQNKREVMDECWYEIKRIFSSLLELYEDKENNGRLYNLLSVYIYAKNLIKADGNFYASIRNNNVVYNAFNISYLEVFDFLDAVSQKPRNEREKYVLKELKQLIFGNANISEFIRMIRYNESEKDKISICLLLYNVLKLNEAKGTGSRFNFLEFANNTWQREHIFAIQNEGVPQNDSFRKSILEMLLENIQSFDTIEGIKNNAYIQYSNYLNSGDVLGFSLDKESEPEEYLNKDNSVKFLKEAQQIQLRYHYIDVARHLIEYRTSSNLKRIHFVSELINYYNDNDFSNTELNIIDYVKEILRVNKNEKNKIVFQEKVIEDLKKELKFDCTTQVNNIFNNFNSEEVTPYQFLIYEEENQPSYEKKLEENIIKAYKNKLKTVIQSINNDISDADSNFIFQALQLNIESMEQVIERFFSKGGSYCKSLSDHSMGNMTLLSGSDNAGISNDNYAKKSDAIYERSKSGSFIPLETLMVFTGAYATDNIIVKEWLPNYRLNYLKEIIRTLSKLEE